MNAANPSLTIPSLPEAELLQAPNARGGNILFVVPTPEGRLILKLYRQRKAKWRGPLRGLAHWIERKRGVSAKKRCQTERLTLQAWEHHGFAAPRVVDRPCPADTEPPCLWMTFCEGRVLDEALKDAGVHAREKSSWLKGVGATLSARHQVALREREPLLLPEHPHVQHVLVDGETFTIFDHEGGYQPGYPIRQAIAAELAGTVRSALRAAPAIRTELLRAFVDGYEGRSLALELCTEMLDGRGISRRLHRWHDGRKRRDLSKMGALRLLREELRLRDSTS